MQLANVTVRLGGSLDNTVPKLGVTPAEILVLQYIHGTDAVVDVRPTTVDKRLRHEEVYQNLSARYDAGAGAFTSTPGEQREGIMAKLFPGAMKRLPMTLEDIGMGHIIVDEEPPAVAPAEPDIDEDDEELASENGSEPPAAETAVDQPTAE